MSRWQAILIVALILAVPVAVATQSARELYGQALVHEHAAGNLTEAIALYTDVIKAAGRDRTLAAQALRHIAGCQEKLGHDAEAADTYASLLRTYPEQRTEVADARERLAVLRRRDPGRSGSARPAQARDVAHAMQPIVAQYCLACHNGRTASGGLDLAALLRDDVSANTTRWELVTRRLQARRDPPMGAPRPDAATYASIVAVLQGGLDAVYAAGRSGAAAAPVDDVELAKRIAAFLWNAPPDDVLLNAARLGRLHDQAGIHQQVGRMLRDARVRGLVDRFFAPWLSLDRITAARPDPGVFPGADAELLQSMLEETRRFVLSQLREDRDAIELWTANYTFVDGRLARHYGLPDITGPGFRRVTWPDATRAGILGQAGPLTALSSPTRTSPTRRGLYILSRFFGTDAPNPPANVPSLAERAPAAGGTLRARISAHRSSPSCASCHSMFDPLGFALENFDGVGHWRTSDGGDPIDASGMFIDGSRFNGPVALRAGLLKYKDAYYEDLTRRLMVHALGRHGAAARVYDDEMRAVRQVVRDAGRQGFRWSSILAGIAASAPFQMPRVTP